MINLKYTVIDEQHNNIQDDEIAINSVSELRGLRCWFQKYDKTMSRQTIVVATMTVINDDFKTVVDYVIHGPITSITDSIIRQFEKHIIREHSYAYLK